MRQPYDKYRPVSHKTCIGDLDITGLDYSEGRLNLFCREASCDFLGNRKFEFKHMILATIFKDAVSFHDDSDLWNMHDKDIVRMNNVWGRGWIYKQYVLMGIPMFVEIGSYDKVNGTENIRYSDEDVELAILTCPDLAQRLVRDLLKSRY